MKIPGWRTSQPTPAMIRPADDELDLFGVTHQGKVRAQNQDQFMVCTIHPQVVVHQTSVPSAESLPLRGTRVATLLLVADGVGGAADGGEAARLATECITQYAASTLRTYHATSGPTDEQKFFDALRKAALEAHAAVRALSAKRPDQRRMATTLTLAITVYPWCYVVQVGDSRCYVFSGNALRQVTRDQTVGQQLVDDGLMPADRLRHSPYSNVLASAIGGDEATPEVTRVDVTERGCVVFLCSDGLTKHVSDAEIETHLRTMQSSEQVCRALVDLALERGGSDNITIVAGRAPLKR